MKTQINLKTWPRRHNVAFFSTFKNPFITITKSIDCTLAMQRNNTEKTSFFSCSLYAILKAVNEIEEFKYRIDKEDKVFLFSEIHAMAVMAIGGDNGEFKIVRIPYIQDYALFCETLKKLSNLENDEADPFEDESKHLESETLDVVMVSAMPFLDFTSITPAQENKNGSSFPLISVGKVTQVNNHYRMPVAISAHHAFVDGFHIAKCFDNIEKYINEKAISI
ncbi:MAG: CatA-like O-acetyltransferase [Bacteroidales bacterium]